MLSEMIKHPEELQNLRKHIQTKLDTGHALNETNRDEPDYGYDDGYEETPPVHVCRIP